MALDGCPDNSAQDNSARTIRRKEYNINLLENSALIHTNSAIFFINPASISAMLFHQSGLHFSNNFSSIPFPFQKYVFINPASISAAIFCHKSRFHFSNIFSKIPLPFQQYLFINPASISAIFFSSVPLPFQQYSSSFPLPCQQRLFVIKYASYNVVIVYNCI